MSLASGKKSGLNTRRSEEMALNFQGGWQTYLKQTRTKLELN